MGSSSKHEKAFGATLGMWSHFRALLVCDHMSPSETSSGSSSPRDRGTFPAAPSAVRATAAAEPRARVAAAGSGARTKVWRGGEGGRDDHQVRAARIEERVVRAHLQRKQA